VVGSAAEESTVAATSQAAGELGGEVVNGLVDADVAEAATAAASVVDDEIDSGVLGCPRSAGPAPAEVVVPVERAAVGPAEPAELVAV
jgi:hypothetical protein